jgi:uncharacterized phiE125 gp8 family phage protein
VTPFNLLKSWTVIAPPAQQPLLTLEEARAQLGLQPGCDCDDADLMRRVEEAVADAETYCGRAFLERTAQLYLDEFPWCGDPIRLPLGKVSAVESVRYYDTDGDLQTLSASKYFTALIGTPARIVCRPESVWPTAQIGRPEAVIVEYTVGWPTPADVPADLIGAVKLILGDRWFHRGDDAKQKEIPDAANRILVAWRAHEVA